MPLPYAIPKWPNVAGETTATAMPLFSTRSTTSATNRPATSDSSRGYDVVSTATFTSPSGDEHVVAPPPQRRLGQLTQCMLNTERQIRPHIAAWNVEPHSARRPHERADALQLTARVVVPAVVE